MTEKTFTQEQINELTNKVLLVYNQAFQNDKMSFMEYTLVENVIIKIQVGLDKMGLEND